jgi:DNA-binding SARP family transcriptional activator
MSVPLVLHLYGPVRVTHHGQVLPLGGPRECSVLGALAMAPGRPVSVERLIAWLWGEAPPARARKSVQNAVMLLRRALAPVGIDVERAGGAYLLRLGECVLDTADPGPATARCCWGSAPWAGSCALPSRGRSCICGSTWAG